MNEYGLDLDDIKGEIQCFHSEEEDSVATIFGFKDEFQDLKVLTR